MEETPRQQGNEPLDSNQVIEARLEARRRSFLPEANDQDPLYSHDREIMLAALGDRARALDDYLRHTPQNAALSMPPGSQTQTPQTTYHVSVAREVYEAAKRFVIEPLPINVSDVLFRFLCVSAGEGLWEKLERDYPPLPTILIRYYFQGATLASLTELASSTSLGHISHLISSTTDYLWE